MDLFGETLMANLVLVQCAPYLPPL